MEPVKRGRGRPKQVKAVSLQLRPEDVKQEVVEAQPEEKKVAVSTVNRSGRPKRVPINGYRDILKVEGQEAGYHYAWITDKNASRFELAGYDFVDHDVVVGDNRVNAASQIGAKISIPGGNGVTLFLMRVPQDIYDEEMEMLNEKIDETELALTQNSREEGRYGSVKIGRGKNL